MANNFAEAIDVVETAPNTYESRHHPETNGTFAGRAIAYGGSTMAIGICAAYRTVKGGHRLYSALGTFIAPARTDRKLLITVTTIRETRSFATRRLDISQKRDGDDAGLRLVMFMLADFHAPEQASLLTYSPSPVMQYSPPEQSLDPMQLRDQMKQKGLPERVEKAYNQGFASTRKHWTTRAAPESFGAQTLTGFMPYLPTSQDDRKITERTTVNYYRPKSPMQDYKGISSALAHILDGGMPLVPVVFSRTSLSKIAVVSSLEFAIRIFSNDLSMDQWLLREEKTIAAGEGRTFQEARLWNAAGKLVASMSQQSILRPKEAKEKL